MADEMAYSRDDVKVAYLDDYEVDWLAFDLVDSLVGAEVESTAANLEHYSDIYSDMMLDEHSEYMKDEG